MPLKAIKKIIQIKVESSYGVDSTPTIGTNDMLVSNLSIVPANIRYAERNSALPFFGAQDQIRAGDTMTVEFDVELTGSGTVAGKPAYSPILRGCAMSETITPTTGPTIYALVTSGEESVTIYYNWDGQLHKILGAFGTSELKLAEGQIPVMHCTFEGLYGSIAAGSFGTPVLTGFKKPLTMNKSNTTFSLHGYAAALASLTITQGNQIEYKNRPNSERMYFTNRKSTGQVVIELPTVAAKDFVDICRSETTGILSLVHGINAGEKVLIDAGQVQLSNPRYTEDSNIAMLTMDMVLKPTSAGNNEWTLKTQ